MKLDKMHSDVWVMKWLLGALIFTSVVLHTQQEEIGKAWNNRLYPTNSVYEVPQTASVQPPVNENNVGNVSKDVSEPSESEDDTRASEEEEYEEYEADESVEGASVDKTSVESRETHYETREEPVEEYDYFYDDYDNDTYSHAPDIHKQDYTLSNESLTNNSPKNPLENISSSPEKEEEEQEEQGAEEAEEKSEQNDGKSIEEDILLGEAVVSVVTTKSVVNGTFSVPTPLPMTTEQMIAPPTSPSSIELDESSISEAIDSTEDSRIVASVQTSRSISGARFLPFNLNTDDRTADKDIKDELSNKTTSESTESIIDKLDRVQSELSSGFLNGGFRTAGNALQLDILGEQRPNPTRKTFTTTGRTPVISKFMPRQRFNDRRASLATTEPSTTESREISEMMSDQPTSERPKSLFKIPWPGSPRSRASSTESSRSATRKPIGAKSKSNAQDITAFLPPGYKLKDDDKTTEKSILSDILSKSKFDISSLLPANYKNMEKTEESSEKNPENSKPSLQGLFSKSQVDISAFLPPDFNQKQKKKENLNEISTENSNLISTTISTPIQKSLQELFSKTSVDISSLLPKDFGTGENDSEKVKQKQSQEKAEFSSVAVESTTKAPAGIKLVFPSRPGGRKAISKTTTSSSRGGGGEYSGAVTPRIQKGWATRSTTEFTGWPTPSTTPISIEKLLEAARTATVSSVNSSMIPTISEVVVTSTTTTTTTTTRPTTPGICEEECEVAGTIRIIGNAIWVPELLDRNTREWQQLADDVEKEMNLVFLKSAILRKWYKNVRIDAFSQGSVLVDYFIELQDLSQKINTQELKVIFHDSLRTYNAHRWNETKVKGPMRLGEFIIDPKSTDFVVIPKLSLPQQIEKDDRLIPQWAIAVIVIGVGGLLFIIVFGVSVLVNRQNAAKLKPTISGMYGEEAQKNIIQSTHVAASHRSSQDYLKPEISTIWNDTDVWREKSFESNSNKILVDGMLIDDKKYNPYDSWRSDFHGYYNNYQPSHSSSKFAGYESTAGFSRHPPDYDTNF